MQGRITEHLHTPIRITIILSHVATFCYPLFHYSFCVHSLKLTLTHINQLLKTIWENLTSAKKSNQQDTNGRIQHDNITLFYSILSHTTTSKHKRAMGACGD